MSGWEVNASTARGCAYLPTGIMTLCTGTRFTHLTGDDSWILLTKKSSPSCKRKHALNLLHLVAKNLKELGDLVKIKITSLPDFGRCEIYLTFSEVETVNTLPLPSNDEQ